MRARLYIQPPPGDGRSISLILSHDGSINCSEQGHGIESPGTKLLLFLDYSLNYAKTGNCLHHLYRFLRGTFCAQGGVSVYLILTEYMARQIEENPYNCWEMIRVANKRFGVRGPLFSRYTSLRDITQEIIAETIQNIREYDSLFQKQKSTGLWRIWKHDTWPAGIQISDSHLHQQNGIETGADFLVYLDVNQYRQDRHPLQEACSKIRDQSEYICERKYLFALTERTQIEELRKNSYTITHDLEIVFLMYAFNDRASKIG